MEVKTGKKSRGSEVSRDLEDWTGKGLNIPCSIENNLYIMKGIHRSFPIGRVYFTIFQYSMTGFGLKRDVGWVGLICH